MQHRAVWARSGSPAPPLLRGLALPASQQQRPSALSKQGLVAMPVMVKVIGRHHAGQLLVALSLPLPVPSVVAKQRCHHRLLAPLVLSQQYPYLCSRRTPPIRYYLWNDACPGKALHLIRPCVLPGSDLLRPAPVHLQPQHS